MNSIGEGPKKVPFGVRLTGIPIDRPVATLMFLLCLTVLGVVSIFRLPLDFMPLIVEPEVDVEVPFPGSHPLEALREVAMPIEEELATIPGITKIEADARSGKAELEARFEWSANIELKKMEVREAVERARPRLPEGVDFIKVEGNVDGPAGGSILQGRISAERNLSESWDLLDRRIKRPLERIKGVARVHLYGVERQQLRIDLDFEALQKHGIEAGELIGKINGANLDMDLGTVRGDLIRYDVRTVAKFEDIEDIQDLPISESGLRLRDVAEVSLREPTLDYGRHLDRRFAVGIDVFKEPSANTVETVDRLLGRIGEIEQDPQLEGINLLVWNNAGEEIRGSLRGLRNAGIIGGIFAVIILFSFLRRFSTTLIVAVAIPFSLMVACGAMYLLGSEFNVLTLLGLMLGVGMLVDNAVVVMENIHRKQGQGLPPREAARVGVREVFMAVVASTATTVIVWSWLLVLERGSLTIYLGSVALTICLAVICSLIISVTLIPLAASRFIPHREEKPGFLLTRIVPLYRGILGFTLRHRMLTLLILVGLSASAVYPVMNVEKSGEPRMLERTVEVNLAVHDTSTKEVLEGHINQVEEALFARKDELGFESMYSWYSEHGGCMVRLYLPKDKATKKDIRALTKKLEGNMPTIAGVKVEVGDREFWRRGSQGRRMVSVALHGEDPEYLEDVALEVEGHLKKIPEAKDVFGPSIQGQKEVRLVVDPDKARNFGVTPRLVADTVGFIFRGRNLRRFTTETGEVEMVMGLPEDTQLGLDALSDVELPREPFMAGEPSVDGGTTVPLGSVAAMTMARTPPQIRREDRKTTSWVTVQFDEEKYTTEEAQELVTTALAGFTLPQGYTWDFGQWGRDRDDALSQMATGVILSLLVVMLLMAALFESLTQPLAIVITLPFAFFGAFWALWLFDYELDPVAFIGIIILIGIVVNNGIVMVDHVNTLRGAGSSRVDALLQGCGHRLRPVLMTAITTLFGLIPLAFSASTVAGAYIDSLAVAVIGGLSTSTLFTLVGLPVWYTMVEDWGAMLARVLPRRGKKSRGLTFPQGRVMGAKEGAL